MQKGGVVMSYVMGVTFKARDEISPVLKNLSSGQQVIAGMEDSFVKVQTAMNGASRTAAAAASNLSKLAGDVSGAALQSKKLAEAMTDEADKMRKSAISAQTKADMYERMAESARSNYNELKKKHEAQQLEENSERHATAAMKESEQAALEEAERLEKAAQAARKKADSAELAANAAYENAQAAVRSAEAEEKLCSTATQTAEAEEKLCSTTTQTAEAGEKLCSTATQTAEAEEKLCSTTTQTAEAGEKLFSAATQTASAEKKAADALDKSEHEAQQYSEAVSKAASESDRLGSSGANTGEILQDAFTTLGIVTALKKIADAFVECTKSAIEYESAITGVYKTVDGSDEQLAQISDDIKAMALEIPSSTTEIAGVAESAGQLGIATENITDFTEVMINLGVATNLTSDEAASSLAKFANITGMAASDYENLGSTIVDLGNNFATTEADIVAMSTRMASAGTLAGMTESDILGLSAAMSSVGIEAEAGGSAMSTLLTNMQIAVETGNGALIDFASVANMTGEEFQRAFKQDAAGALYAFIDGLNDVGRNGKTATVILEDMGIKEIRLSNAVKSLANNSEGLAGAINLAGEAWGENTALAEEVGKRYGTLESRLEITRNAANNLKIAVGDVLTPAVGNFADTGTKALVWLTGFVEENPAVVKAVTVTVAAITGSVAAISAVTFAVNVLKPAISKLTVTMMSNPIFAGITIAAGVITGIAALTAVINGSKDTVEDYSGTLEQCSGEIESTQTAYANVCKMYGANSDAAKSLKDDLETLNAQYEKGGGFIADYDQRLADSKQSINAMTTEYHDKLDKINDDWKNGLVATAQLDALSDKTELTNSDLDMMSKYADYLNDTFDCNIKVNYDTGELTNFNPEEITSKLVSKAQENRVQAASDFVTSSDFTNKYISSIDNLDAIEKEYEEKRNKINAAIADYTVANDTGYSLEELDEEYGKRIKEAQGQISTLENEAYNAYSIMGMDGADDYLERIRDMTDSYQELDEAAENANESMMLPATGAKEALSSVSDELQQLAQDYDDAYEAAIESFQGQWGLFDEASANAEATVENAQKALDSQLEYWTGYQENIEYMSQMTAQELGVTQQEYDSFMSYVRDGSPEAVALLADMRTNMEGENKEAVQKLIETHAEIESKQESIAETTSEWATHLEERMGELVHRAEMKINELDMSDDARRGAVNTINSYANQIRAQTSQAVSSAQSVVDAVQAVFNNSSIDYTPIKGSKGSVNGNAEGTLSAAQGYAMVGERGPELIRFSGGERVYNADETIKIMSDPKSLELPGLWKNAYASGTDSAERGVALVGEKGPELVFMNGGEKVYTAAETERIFKESPVYRDYSTDRRIVPPAPDVTNTDIFNSYARNISKSQQSASYMYDNSQKLYSMYNNSKYSSADVSDTYKSFFDVSDNMNSSTLNNSFYEGERPLYVAPPASPYVDSRNAQSETTVKHEHVLNINGKGSIKVDGISKSEAVDLLSENIKPVLMEIIEQEMFEEGESAYET